jgi:hypothetical protein
VVSIRRTLENCIFGTVLRPFDVMVKNMASGSKAMI